MMDLSLFIIIIIISSSSTTITPYASDHNNIYCCCNHLPYLSIHLSIQPSTLPCIPTYLSTYPYIHLPTLPTHPTYLPIYPPTHQSTLLTYLEIPQDGVVSSVLEHIVSQSHGHIALLMMMLMGHLPTRLLID